MASLAVAAAVTAAAGAVVGGVQGAAAARSQSKLAKQQAELERRGATVAERQERERGARFRASQRAAFGAAGVTQAGTPGLVLAETAEAQERDALAIRFGGKIKESRALSESALAKRRGQQALVAGGTGAITTLLGSGAFKKRS